MHNIKQWWTNENTIGRVLIGFLIASLAALFFQLLPDPTSPRDFVVNFAVLLSICTLYYLNKRYPHQASGFIRYAIVILISVTALYYYYYNILQNDLSQAGLMFIILIGMAGIAPIVLSIWSATILIIMYTTVIFLTNVIFADRFSVLNMQQVQVITLWLAAGAVWSYKQKLNVAQERDKAFVLLEEARRKNSEYEANKADIAEIKVVGLIDGNLPITTNNRDEMGFFIVTIHPIKPTLKCYYRIVVPPHLQNDVILKANYGIAVTGYLVSKHHRRYKVHVAEIWATHIENIEI